MYKKENRGKLPSEFHHIENQDCFSQILYHMMQARNLRVDEYDLSDYSKQVRIIVNEGRNFAKDLLALCVNLDEAKLLLSHDALLDSYSLTKEETKWDYKCLDEAVLSNHKEIVTQDFSQRIFRETWHNNEELNPLRTLHRTLSQVLHHCHLYSLLHTFAPFVLYAL